MLHKSLANEREGLRGRKGAWFALEMTLKIGLALPSACLLVQNVIDEVGF